MLNTGYVIPNWNENLTAIGYKGKTHWGKPNEKVWDHDDPYWNLKWGYTEYSAGFVPMASGLM